MPDPSQVAPVALDEVASDAFGARRSFRYAFEPGGPVATRALVGVSHEYTCHVARDAAKVHPELAGRYCSFGNVDEVLDGLSRDGLNLVRLYGVLNHGLGLSLGEPQPYPYEQPFVRDGPAWDLARLEPIYLDRLESVVRAAYCRHLIVELTLLDPWDGEFASSPFAAANTVGKKQGLAAKADFLRPGNRAQAFQKAAVVAIVERLKRYPNLIWEVANEPDLAPDGISVAEVAAFERLVIEEWIAPHDSAHLVMVNGHQPGALGWELPRVAVASAHYAELLDGRLGALELLRVRELAPQRARVAVAFNEGKALGSSPEVEAADVRAEAWEFLFAGGSLFDAYSVDRQAPATVRASAELGVLARVFRSGGEFFGDLSALRPSACGPNGWCDGIPDRGEGAAACAPGARPRSAALETADGSELALYVDRASTVSTPGSPQSPFARLDMASCGSLTLDGFVVRLSRAGCWRLRWIAPRDGAILREEVVLGQSGVPVAFPPAPVSEDAAFFARRVADSCPPPP